jgi:predicted MFS family arabinose efflux permease
MTEAAARRGPWTLALLFTVGVINMFDRQIINILAQQIKLDLAISDAQLGLLTGTAFAVFYALMGMPLGHVADKVNRIKLIGVCLVLWSGFTAVCGFTRTFTQLFAARVAVGVGEAGSQPASVGLIPDLFPEARRGLAMSLLMLCVPVGSFLGLWFGGLVGSAWGWRAAFAVAGLPGFLLALVLFATASDPRHPSKDTSKPQGPSIMATVAMTFRRPGYLAMVGGNICSALLANASGAWLPAFFIRVHHMKTAEIGSFAAVAVGLGGGIGTFGGGAVCDLMRRWVKEVETVVLVVVSLLAALTLLGAVLCHDRDTALAYMFAFWVTSFAFLAPMVRATQRAATPATRGLAIGITSSIAAVMSLGVGLPVVGAIGDALAARSGARSIGYALALVTAFGVVGAFAYGRAGVSLRRFGTAEDCESAPA